MMISDDKRLKRFLEFLVDSKKVIFVKIRKKISKKLLSYLYWKVRYEFF